jgi:DNA-binding MarR family transcriptional regulator
MTAKKNWKLDWYDAVAADKRVDPAAFKVAYCMRRNLLRRTFAARVGDKALSTGISVAEVKRALKKLERRGWISEWIEPNTYSFMGDYLAEQRDADQRTTAA